MLTKNKGTRSYHKQETPLEFIIYCAQGLSFASDYLHKIKRQITSAKKSQKAIKIVRTIHLLDSLCKGIDTEVEGRLGRFRKSMRQFRKMLLRVESGIITAYNKAGRIKDDGTLEAMDEEDKENNKKAKEND
jgi:hypothetical protein